MIDNTETNNTDTLGKRIMALRKAAGMSVCKINVDTDIRLAVTASIRQHMVEHPEDFDPRAYLKPARAAVKAMVAHKIRNVMGSSGKA